MSDPLAHSLPWLDLGRKLFPVGRYLVVRQRVMRRIRERDALEAMRRGRIRHAQTCLLHGWPQDVTGLQAEGPLWCGCWWHRDVIYTRGGGRQRVIRVGRRDPVTSGWLVATFEDTGDYPDRDVLERVREAFAESGETLCSRLRPAEDVVAEAG